MAPAHDFQAGAGIGTDPYLICNSSQFEKIETTPAYLDSEYKLAKDIDLAGSTFLPLATTAAPFTGVLDGNGFELQSPTQLSGSTDVGIFAVVENATLRNLIVVNPSFSGSTNIGALAGTSKGSSVIENNTVLFTLASKVIGTLSSSTYVGGLVGLTQGTSILRTNKVHLGNLPGESRIVGRTDVAGLVGRADGTSIIEYNSVTGSGKIWGAYSPGSSRVGGLVGIAATTGVTIRESKVDRDVSVYAQANISTLGGLVGELDGTLENSYFLGSVAISSPNASDKFGGLVGRANNLAIVKGVVFYPYSVTPSTSTSTAAIVGHNDSDSVCDIAGQGCVYSYYTSSGPATGLTNECAVTACDSRSYSTSTGSYPTAVDFTNAFGGASALSYDPSNFNKWMFDVTILPNGKFARQWETVATLDRSFIDTTKSKIFLSGLQGSFVASTGKGALRSNICKANGHWYWEVTLLKGDWNEEFGILAASQGSPATELSTNRTTLTAWSLMDTGTSFAPYRGSGLDNAYSPTDSIIVKKDTTTTVRPEVGDVIGIRLDLQSGTKKIQYFLNGEPLAQVGGFWNNYTISGNLTIATCAAVGKFNPTSQETSFDVNFGSRQFKYPANITGPVKPYNFLE